jgi:DNA-binding Lrp family transcriptional regulator
MEKYINKLDKHYCKCSLRHPQNFFVFSYVLRELFKMNPDKKDALIIDALKQNSRLSVRDISKKTGIRPSTVHERIKKLVKEKAIEKFTLKLDNKVVGENFIVFMLIKGGTTEYINSRVTTNAHIKEIFGITGEYDLLLKLKFRDVEEFNDFLIKFRKEQKGVRQTYTMVTTANIKEEV